MALSLLLAFGFSAVAAADQPAQPRVKSKVIEVTYSANGPVVIVLSKGADSCIKKGDHGVLLDTQGNRSACNFKINRVQAQRSRAFVECDVATVKRNKRAWLF